MANVINLDDFGGIAGDPLKWKDLTSNFTVLTVKKYGTQKNQGQGRKLSAVLVFNETDKILYLNRKQLEYIVAKCGADTDKWVGQRIPVEKVKVEFDNAMHDKIYVMAPEAWDEAITEFDSLNSGSKPPKASKRTGAKA